MASWFWCWLVQNPFGFSVRRVEEDQIADLEWRSSRTCRLDDEISRSRRNDGGFIPDLGEDTACFPFSDQLSVPPFDWTQERSSQTQPLAQSRVRWHSY